MMCNGNRSGSAIVTTLAILFGLLFFPSQQLAQVQPGDIVIITGSSTGIGKDAALSLAMEGYTVFACVRKTHHGDALQAAYAQELEQKRMQENKVVISPKDIDNVSTRTDNLKILILDVTNSKQITQAVDTVTAYIGELPAGHQQGRRQLKGLFNNAGIGGEVAFGTQSTAIEYTEMSEYRKVFDVNYFGLVEVTKAFLPLLRTTQDSRIIMNSSVAGFVAAPFFAAYASTKHAVEGFSDSLRRELHPMGVHVSILECGPVKTAIVNGNVPQGREPYTQAEQSFWRWFWNTFVDAPPPRESSSRAVLHALQSSHPQIRYVTGKNAPLLKIGRYIPAPLSDVLMRFKVSHERKINNEELSELLKDEHVLKEETH